jgi:hypothetical protein
MLGGALSGNNTNNNFQQQKKIALAKANKANDEDDKRETK